MPCISKMAKPSQVDTLTIAKSQTHNTQDKGTLKGGIVYGERGVLVPVLASGGE
jgi:hypothetical protein